MAAHSPECSGWTRMPVRPDPDHETVTAATCADCGEQVGTITLTPIDPPDEAQGAGPAAGLSVGQFQVHADEEGDLRLLCPRAEDLGCLFGAELLSGSTIAQIIQRASLHTGEAAEDAHAFIRAINGESGTPPAGEGDPGA